MRMWVSSMIGVLWILCLSNNPSRGAENVVRDEEDTLSCHHSEQSVPMKNWNMPTDTNRKSPTCLTCYLNYTLKDSFCHCTWKAGEESQHATYVLHYCNHRSISTCYDFMVGIPTHYMIKEDDIYLKETISLWVEATENGQVYKSTNFTVILENAVKLDPPETNNVQLTKENGSVTITWKIVDHLALSQPFLKNIQYKTKYNSAWREALCDLDKTTLSRCVTNENDLNICTGTGGSNPMGLDTEVCILFLDKHLAHQIRIRHRYREGIWSDWSDSVYVPADISHSPKINYSIGKLTPGKRELILRWQKATEEQGDVEYNISLEFISCPGVKTHFNIKDDHLITNISGAPYQLTMVAFNSAEKAPPWSSVIKEDVTGKPFESVNLLGSSELRVTWDKEVTGKATYCIAWKLASKEWMSPNSLSGDYEDKEATIITDFQPMQCYQIMGHKISSTQCTIGTTYYFKPSQTIGPGNLTVMNLTAHSVLMKWEGFDLRECQELLETWVIIITDTEKNITIEYNRNSSENQYLVQNLTSGSHYTLKVKGVTVFGEDSGSSQMSIITLTAVVNNDMLWPLIMGICFGIISTGIICCFGIIRLKISLCPALPDPNDSSATKFASDEKKQIPHHVCESYENGHTGPLIVEPRTEDGPPEIVSRESFVNHWTLTMDQTENDNLVTSELGDLPFEYRMQMIVASPGNEKRHMNPNFFQPVQQGHMAQ